MKELLPLLMTKPLGPELIMRLFVDADYACDGVWQGGSKHDTSYSSTRPQLHGIQRGNQVLENLAFGSDQIAMGTGLETSHELLVC